MAIVKFRQCICICLYRKFVHFNLIKFLNDDIYKPAKHIKLNMNKNNKPLPKFLLDIIKIKRRAYRLFMKQRTDDNKRLYRRTQEDVKAAISIYDEIKYKNFTNKLQDLWTTNPKKFGKPSLD